MPSPLIKPARIAVVLLIGTASFSSAWGETKSGEAVVPEVNSKRKVDTFDCAQIEALALSPKEFEIRLRNDTKANNDADMNKLRRAACTALKGAGLAEGTKPEWFAKLPFILVDGAKEGPYDATYQNGIQQAIESSALVSVSVQLLKGFSEAELVWTLGHELGHGVNSDVGYKKAMDAAAFGAPIAGAILSSSSKLKALKGLAKGAALGAGIYAYKKCWYAPGSEKKADTYGLLVLEKLNYDKTKAIGIATSAIQKMDKANPPPPDKMLGCMTPGLSEHPSPAARIKNLQKFAAKGDSTSSAKGSAPEDK